MIRSPIASSLLVAIGLALASATANAQQSEADRTLAETLFREGRELMQQKQYDKACPKLAESQRLDPGGGTLLNLALCHEMQGKTASAWGEYREALALARDDRRSDRIDFAQTHLKALEPNLARLTIKVPQATRVEGLVLKLDGVQLRAPLWDSPLPVDPGARVLEASAPGHKTWKMTVQVAPGAQLDQSIPALESAPVAPAVDHKGAPEAGNEATPASSGGSRRTVGYTLGGLGVVSLGVGTYFGVKAINERSASNDQCPGGRCTAEGVRQNDNAKHSANFCDVGLGIGVVLVGVGTYLVLSAPSGAPAENPVAASPTALRVRAAALPGHAAIAVEGAF